jgi:hypothetical protein
MNKKVVFTIILVVIGLSSLTFGAISFGLITMPKKLDSQAKKELQAKKEQEAKKKEETKKKEEETKKKEEAKKKEQQAKEKEKNLKENLIIPKGPMAAWLISDSEKEKGIQKALSEKSKQVTGVWAALKTVNGVINVLQSARIGGAVETSVNPMEFLSPDNNVLNKISNLLLWAAGAVFFEKILLAISGYIVFLIVIPVCVIISIITIWTSKDKTKISKVVIVSVLVSLIMLFAIPVSFYMSSFIEKKALINNVNTVLESINAKGNTAAKMEKELTSLRKVGGPITTNLTNAKKLGEAIIEDANNYFVIFVFTNIIIPILTIFGLFLLARYSAGLILKKSDQPAKNTR